MGRVLAACFREQKELFTERLIDKNVLEFGAKEKLLNGIVKDEITRIRKETPAPDYLEKLVKCKDILSKFTDEIIHVRNALAHQVSAVNQDGEITVKKMTSSGAPIVITCENCTVIRQDIRKHMRNLLDLENLISEMSKDATN
jgi:hypothetical protein